MSYRFNVVSSEARQGIARISRQQAAAQRDVTRTWQHPASSAVVQETVY